MKDFDSWTALNEAGIPGPDRPINHYAQGRLTSQALPMRDMSEQGMRNLVRYLEEAGQQAVHDPLRNATRLRMETKGRGDSYLVLNYNGTWHFERRVEGPEGGPSR